MVTECSVVIDPPLCFLTKNKIYRCCSVIGPHYKKRYLIAPLLKRLDVSKRCTHDGLCRQNVGLVTSTNLQTSVCGRMGMMRRHPQIYFLFPREPYSPYTKVIRTQHDMISQRYSIVEQAAEDDWMSEQGASNRRLTLVAPSAVCGVVGSEKQEKMGAGRRTMSPPSIKRGRTPRP